MERPKKITLPCGTVVSADPERPFNRFLKIEKPGVTVAFSLTEAAEVYRMLSDYFAEAEVMSGV